ncbi:MAG: choice-of-anchor S family protein [Candidatus Heimdallarchaeota archaeon]
MRKKGYTTLALIAMSLTIITLPSSTLGSSQYWGVSNTESYNYDLNDVNIVYNIPPTSYNATAITFDNTSSIPEGSLVQLNITDVQSLNLTYDLISNGLVETHIITNATYEDQFYNLLLLPLRFANKEVDLSDIKRGLTGIDYILVPKAESTWETLDDYDNPVFVVLMQELFNSIAEVNVQAKAELNTTTDECLFEWYVNGTYFDDVAEMNFDFTYNLKFAYEMSTGLLLGMRVDLDISGINTGDNLVIRIQSEVEREGYTLDEFILPSGDGFNLGDIFSNLFPAFQWWIVPLTLVPISFIGIIVKRRR